MRHILLFALLIAITPWAAAQRMAGPAFPMRVAAQPPAPQGTTISFVGPQRFSRRSGFSAGSFFPGSWFASPYTDDLSANPPGAQPTFILMQPTPAVSALRDEPAVLPQPLMIEWQGDHYARVAGPEAEREPEPGEDRSGHVLSYSEKTAATAVSQKPRAARAGTKTHPAVPQAAADLAPVLLILRDGRHQEVRDYTIADGVLYARGDYWTDGYWNQKIELSALNLPGTFQANLDRGVKFVLPNGPNQVITRP
jgi:hypothetical protein